MITEATSIIFNNLNKDNNNCSCDYLQSPDVLPVYRWRNCDTNMNSNTPETQYQKQKIIQNTVRVASSLYTMNLGSLSGYENANKTTEQNVCWNQMSDRIHPHIQKNTTASGSSYGGNSTKRSLFRLRPGAMSPGGKGVDIKHNSYERRLNRLKGQSVLRRERVPPTFGSHIPFNPAFPVYGGKTIKTNIIAGCDCNNSNDDSLLNVDPYTSIYDVQYEYSPDQLVYIIEYDLKTGEQFYYIGTIVSQVDKNNYNISLQNGNVKVYNVSRIFPYIYNNNNVSTTTNTSHNATSTVAIFSNIANIVNNNTNINAKRPLAIINTFIQNDINNAINSNFKDVLIPDF